MSNFIHGDNIQHKIRIEFDKYNKSLLEEIWQSYLKWKFGNLSITGITFKDIRKKVELFNEYKKFIDQPKFKKCKGNPHGFPSQSQLHSSVLEEFLYYLFKDIPKLKDKNFNWGRIDAYTNLYFSPRNIDEFDNNPGLSIHTKNQDFCISKRVIIRTGVENNSVWQEKQIFVPIVAIECKTYIDKTMYEGSVSTAEKIKKGNPYCIFLIVTETYSVSLDVDPKCSLIDQIYVLRKDKSISAINTKIVWDLFRFVYKHINSNWSDIASRLKRGKMI